MAGLDREVPGGSPQSLVGNARVSVPGAALLCALLGMLSFDYSHSVAALSLHFVLGLLRGALIALVAAWALRRSGGTPAAVALGSVLGLIAGLLPSIAGVDEPLLLAVGAGVMVAALVQLLARLPATEALASLLLCGLFFLIISTFWILKSIKKGLFVSWHKATPIRLGELELSAAGAEQLAKIGNMVFAVLAMIAFIWLSRRYQRQRLVAGLALAFALVFLGFRVLLSSPSTGVVWAVYLGGDLFNTFLVTAFFAFVNDSVAAEQARRSYPVIVFGGVLGGALGSTTVRSLQRSIGDSALLYLCAIAAIGMALLAVLAARHLGADRREAPATPADSALAPRTSPGSSALEGARLVRASPYLLAIVTVVGVYEFCSATLDYQWTASQVLLLDGEAAIRQHTASVYALTNWVAMLAQLLLTAPLLARFGVGATLLVLPSAFLGGSMLFLVLPALWTGALLSVSDNSLNYSVNQSAREALWVATSRVEKYRAKAFIDMFVQRLGKVIAVGLALGLDAIGPAWARWLSLPVIVLLLIWIAAARRAGSEFRERTRSG